ncbi:ABC transporter substrate-binding protein [Frankia sp. CNm7]|uniref:ABC transporter substrate-binding protein n=1 Tax=Frankia nepalensis TaxID=1836974 RepID=A0A937RH74_9ACTN|nr:ABC transporter substrate-binding protein [Frankia nepalensis]MBL7499238.1 ABC transporter substrate-binding protein [Frankia nepalensis]MBL7512116.1 ABC transporter substrate-binding protein [Frankia nepalensis]MBL7521035.1 ABC transporter substrate-binding protein [Frankia nepalensis]MBL7627309.1 ABC transporter substrate-binding protein [Frankia nepalensis]
MNRRRTRARTATAAVALLVGLPGVLAGCDSSPATGPGSADAACSAPGVTADSIKIGLIFPDSGGAIATSFGAARGAAEARIGAQNATGGVHGRRIDLVWRDDASREDQFARAAHELVDTEGVFGLIATSIALGPSADWLASDRIPVTGVATGDAWGKHDNLFHFGSLFNQGGAVDTFGRFARARGATRALIVVDPGAAASGGLAHQYAPSLRSQGVEVVGEAAFTSGISSPAKVVSQLRATGADALVGAIPLETFIDIYAAAKNDGVRLRVALTNNGYSSAMLARRGPDMAGMSVIVGYHAFEQKSPAMLAYQEAMARYAPELADPNGELALGAYVATDEMIKGLEVAGPCPSRESFIANLRQVHDFDAGGLVAPTDLSTPNAPAACFNFLTVDPAGTAYTVVPGNQPDGFWCGGPVDEAAGVSAAGDAPAGG